MLLVLLACTAPEDSTSGSELPPEESREIPVDSTPFTVDSGIDDGPSDTVPEHSLLLRHEGFWLLTPLGGPYRAITGELLIQEILDGDEEEPACSLRYALTGTPEAEGCAGCDFSFRVTHYLAEGDPELCQQPDLPAEQEVFGWNEPTLYKDYAESGLWLAWYDGALVEDELSFSWEQTVGLTVEEEE